MNPNEVIDAYVADVMGRVPGRDRNEIGLELRGLLGEMLADRADEERRLADDAMVLAMLREFGNPAEIAARYRPPGLVIIPAEQTRSFVLLSLVGVGVQWALTLPRVFEGLPLSGWWLSWGLGSFWWPGFMVMIALLATWLRKVGLFKPVWRPRVVDPERVNRGALGLGLFWFALGVALMVCLPWIVGLMPDPLPRIFAFDPVFLHERAWPVLLLWLGTLATLATVFAKGRWTSLTRRLEIGFNLGFVALLGWWLIAGNIFLAQPTDDGAKAAIGLVIVFIVGDLLLRLYRQYTRRPPRLID